MGQQRNRRPEGQGQRQPGGQVQRQPGGRQGQTGGRGNGARQDQMRTPTKRPDPRGVGGTQPGGKTPGGGTSGPGFTTPTSEMGPMVHLPDLNPLTAFA